MRTPTRSPVRAVLVLVVLALAVVTACLAPVPLLERAGPLAAAGVASAGYRPVVVQRAEARLEGPDAHGVQGPRAFRAVLPRPSTPGDLLVVGVVDGVLTSGMRQPDWRLLRGWRRGADTVGGQTATNGSGPPSTGGLQASIWYWPDNPGGVRSVSLGQVPKGTQAASTAFIAELSGVPPSLPVAGTGSATSGSKPTTWKDWSTVSLRRPISTLPALVLTVFVNGGTSRSGERFWRSPGWTLIGQDLNRNGNQPILFDARMWRSRARPTDSMRYDVSIDNCAAMVALG